VELEEVTEWIFKLLVQHCIRGKVIVTLVTVTSGTSMKTAESRDVYENELLVK